MHVQQDIQKQESEVNRLKFELQRFATNQSNNNNRLTKETEAS